MLVTRASNRLTTDDFDRLGYGIKLLRPQLLPALKVSSLLSAKSDGIIKILLVLIAVFDSLCQVTLELGLFLSCLCTMFRLLSNLELCVLNVVGQLLHDLLKCLLSTKFFLLELSFLGGKLIVQFL